jgi:hypothetical protein
VLELVVRELLCDLGEVTRRDELEVRLALVVDGEMLVLDLPALRTAFLEGRERVAKARRVGSEAPESAPLLAPVRMAEPEAIAGRSGLGAARQIAARRARSGRRASAPSRARARGPSCTDARGGSQRG